MEWRVEWRGRDYLIVLSMKEMGEDVEGCVCVCVRERWKNGDKERTKKKGN